MRKLFLVTLLAIVPLTLPGRIHAADTNHSVRVALHPVGGSGITGTIVLKQLHTDMGTRIHVQARGLVPGHMYRSLYYGNATCAIEPYSSSDVIGGDYRANREGHGHTKGVADDNLDDIHSVSVRDASQPFSPTNPGRLLACATIGQQAGMNR